MKAVCPRCGIIELTILERMAATVTCGALGATFGSKLAKNPYAALFCVIAGLAVGSYLDRELQKHCPQCGAILRIAGFLTTTQRTSLFVPLVVTRFPIRAVLARK